MSFNLFQLVPAVYRLRDGQIAANLQTAQGPLESLLGVIEEQLEAMAADLDQLYDDQFIETCAPWVIPYIGDLIGYQSIQGIPATVDDPRSEVADTIALRRRKGTVLVLEQLARDITGWGAHAREFFEVLGTTQYVKHVRRWNHYAPDVRGWGPRLYRKGGFSRVTHKVDVHNSTSPGLPRYNLQNIGVFLWSLGAYGISQGTPSAASTNSSGQPLCYRFSSLGNDMPLMHAAVYQGESIADAATEKNVPDFLPRPMLCADLRKGVGTAYYGEGASLALYLNGQFLNPYQIQVADLSGTDGSWNNLPAAGSPFAVVVDPQLGRIALPAVSGSATAPTLSVSYCYGCCGPIGGGEYERAADFTVSNTNAVFPYPDTATTPRYTTIQDALNYVVSQFSSTQAALALEIVSSETLPITTAAALTVDLPAGTTFEFRAQDGCRPTILLNGELQITGAANTTFLLNGLVIAASVGMTPGSAPNSALVHIPALRPGGSANLLATLNLTDCTLVPGWALQTTGDPVYPAASALIAESSGLQITVETSILGAVRAPEFVTVSLSDSVIDATDRGQVAYAALDGLSGGAPLTLQGCTVIGGVHAQALTLVTDSIILASPISTLSSGLIADRLQVGCVRFSFLPVQPVTPRRYECVIQALAAPQPIFFSLRYGSPGYLKLLACTDNSIRRGAEDGGEMGAFHYLLAPLRESDLLIRLQEYLPVGLEVGLVYQT